MNEGVGLASSEVAMQFYSWGNYIVLVVQEESFYWIGLKSDKAYIKALDIL